VPCQRCRLGKATAIKSALEISVRLNTALLTANGLLPNRCTNTFTSFRDRCKEYFIVLLLTETGLSGKYKSPGIPEPGIVHPREVFNPAGAFSGRHDLGTQPSIGRIDPSREDREITRRLKEAGELMGVAARPSSSATAI
jgi:DNA repair protein RadC